MSTILERPTEVEDHLVRQAQQFYDQNLRKTLEPDQVGRFVAIEPETERYFLGDSGTSALVEAHAAMPEHVFYLVRIGYEAADTLHGYGNRIR